MISKRQPSKSWPSYGVWAFRVQDLGVLVFIEAFGGIGFRAVGVSLSGFIKFKDNLNS